MFRSFGPRPFRIFTGWIYKLFAIKILITSQPQQQNWNGVDMLIGVRFFGLYTKFAKVTKIIETCTCVAIWSLRYYYLLLLNKFFLFSIPFYLWHIFMTTKHGFYQFIINPMANRKETSKSTKKTRQFFYVYARACHKHKNDNGNCLKAHVK